MCPLLQAALEPHPAIVLADLRALYEGLHRALIVGQLVARPAHPAGRGDVPVGHDADAGQRPVESVARPIAPGDRLVDPSREQELGRDLPRPLGQPDLIARHAGTAPAVVALLEHPLRVDGVAQAIHPLQLMHDLVATRTVVVVADRLAVEAHARGDDVDVILGVPHHDVERVREAHALQVVAAERAPVLLGQPLPHG